MLCCHRALTQALSTNCWLSTHHRHTCKSRRSRGRRLVFIALVPAVCVVPANWFAVQSNSIFYPVLFWTSSRVRCRANYACCSGCMCGNLLGSLVCSLASFSVESSQTGSSAATGAFVVCHYAGNVEYTAEGMMQKNQDTLQPDLVSRAFVSCLHLRSHSSIAVKQTAI
jgi:hypothetical protein